MVRTSGVKEVGHWETQWSHVWICVRDRPQGIPHGATRQENLMTNTSGEFHKVLKKEAEESAEEKQVKRREQLKRSEHQLEELIAGKQQEAQRHQEEEHKCGVERDVKNDSRIKRKQRKGRKSEKGTFPSSILLPLFPLASPPSCSPPVCLPSPSFPASHFPPFRVESLVGTFVAVTEG